MSQVILIVVAALALLITVLIVRTARLKPADQPAAPPQPLPFDREAAVERLAQAVRFRTVSHPDLEQVDRQPFLQMQHFIEAAFPLVHRSLARRAINDLSLL